MNALHASPLQNFRPRIRINQCFKVNKVVNNARIGMRWESITSNQNIVVLLWLFSAGLEWMSFRQGNETNKLKNNLLEYSMYLNINIFIFYH